METRHENHAGQSQEAAEGTGSWHGYSGLSPKSGLVDTALVHARQAHVKRARPEVPRECRCQGTRSSSPSVSLSAAVP